MDYYEHEDEFKARGIDYDLAACLEYNSQSFDVMDIQKVLAVWEGENDGDDWRWVLQLLDGRYVFIQGGCSYTGWDCQSWAISEFTDTALNATEFALGNIAPKDKSPQDAGLGHMLSIMTGGYTANFKIVRDALVKQLTQGKSKTWREGKDEEFGL